MSAETRRLYEFGKFRLDPSAKVLFCERKPVSLTPKVFDTLQVFVEHAGRLLAKDELMQKIWQDRFVEESNLTFNIKVLRRALNDDARNPRFIETVPRRGYRFIAEVKEVVESAGKDLNNSGLEVLQLSKRRSYFPIAVLAVLLASAALMTLWFARRSFVRSTLSAPILSAPILSIPFKSEPFSTTGRLHAVITPDGKYVAYTGETEGKENIWLRKLETSENIQIVPPSEDYYLGLAVSHDGNSLYFVRQHQTDRTPPGLYRVMTFGGIPAKLSEKMEGWISVSPDDRQISYVRCNYQDDDYCALFVVDADGRNERRILSRPRPIRISDNQFSPDGKSIAIAEGESSSGGSDFHLTRVDLANGAETRISPRTFFNIENLKWLPGGQSLLLAAKESLNGRIRIWQVSTRSGEANALTRDATDYMSISLDQAADKMIATHASNNFRLYLARLGELNTPRDLASAGSLTFTPGGKLIYSADDGHIWTINQDGGEQRQLTNGAFADFSPRVSPDGHYIFFASNRTGLNQVWRMNTDGSNQVQLTNEEGGYPRFVSPDGKWLYFDSGLHDTLWRVSTESGAELQVSERRVSIPAFSSDGRLVAYSFRANEGNSRGRIGVMSVENGQVVKIFDLPDDKSGLSAIAWSSDNLSFNYVTAQTSKNILWNQPLTSQKPRQIADLGNEAVKDFAASPDGNIYGFVAGKWIHDAVLIEGLR